MAGWGAGEGGIEKDGTEIAHRSYGEKIVKGCKVCYKDSRGIGKVWYKRKTVER